MATLQKCPKGYANVHQEDGAKEDESFIVGERAGRGGRIEIQAHGSKTAFEDLKSGLCDIGMSSRKIKPEEQQRLSSLGDLASSASEHVLALDGIALVVHPSNPVRALSVAQVADIFSGTLTDWSQVGGRAGAIAIYARDDQSGTYDFFKEAVLKSHGKTLAASAQRFAAVPLYRSEKSMIISSCFTEVAQRMAWFSPVRFLLREESYAVCAAAGNSSRSHDLSTSVTSGRACRSGSSLTDACFTCKRAEKH